MTALVVIEAIVIALLVVLVAGLLRSHADILRKLDSLGAGDDATNSIVRSSRPDIALTPMRTEPASVTSISGPTPFGDTVSVALAGSRGSVLLAFLSSGCSTCETFWKSFRNGMDLPSTDIRPVIITQGTESESPGDIRKKAPTDMTTITAANRMMSMPTSESVRASVRNSSGNAAQHTPYIRSRVMNLLFQR